MSAYIPYLWKKQPCSSYVKKNGGVLQSNFDVGNHRILGLKKPKSPKDAANKLYVDSRKPVIQVTGQVLGGWKRGLHQIFTFGGTGNTPLLSGTADISHVGFVLPVAGQIMYASIGSRGPTVGTLDRNVDLKVYITLDHTFIGDYYIDLPATQFKAHKSFGPSNPNHVLPAGTTINFAVRSEDYNGIDTVVSVLIQLDL